MVDENTSKKKFYEKNSIQEYYDLIMEEYSVERDKKNSFDSRAGIILGFLGIIVIYIFDGIKINELFNNLGDPIQLQPTLKILVVLVTIISFFVSLYYSIRVLNVEAYTGYKVSNITKDKLKNNSGIYTKALFVMEYKEVVMSYRANNLIKAKYLYKSIFSIAILIISTFIKNSF